MTTDDVIRDRLVDQLGATVSGVYAVVASDENDKPIPTGEIPFVVVQLVSDTRDFALDGPIITGEARYQVSIYRTLLAAVRSAKDAVITALHNYKTTGVKFIRYENSLELFEAPNEYHIPADFIVSF